VPIALASASVGTVNSITDFADLSFRSAGTNRVTTFLDNAFDLYVDHKLGAGGTILYVGGMLTNTGELHVGNTTLSAPDEVSAASLDNTGLIHLVGSSVSEALLDVSNSAGFGSTGVLSGDVRLGGDSAIEFASGQITTIAKGASLSLNGSDAFIEDSTTLGSNSAVTGLSDFAGSLYLGNGASISTTGAVTNSGLVRLYANEKGGSALSIGGALTNTGTLDIGSYHLFAPTSITATSFVNSGTVDLTGHKTNSATIDVSGTTTNNGAINIRYDTEEFTGAVRGTGHFSLSSTPGLAGVHLLFDSSDRPGRPSA
jgi:hypothetical protein